MSYHATRIFALNFTQLFNNNCSTLLRQPNSLYFPFAFQHCLHAILTYYCMHRQTIFYLNLSKFNSRCIFFLVKQSTLIQFNSHCTPIHGSMIVHSFNSHLCSFASIPLSTSLVRGVKCIRSLDAITFLHGCECQFRLTSPWSPSLIQTSGVTAFQLLRILLPFVNSFHASFFILITFIVCECMFYSSHCRAKGPCFHVFIIQCLFLGERAICSI